MPANPIGGLQQACAGWERIRGTADINFDRMISWQELGFHATGLKSVVVLGFKCNFAWKNEQSPTAPVL
jgi:hypothetical protein